LIGIEVDAEIIKELISKTMPQLYSIMEEQKKNYGDFLGNTFICRGLTNLFSYGMINKDLSLLIWDYLFIEGNIVLIKSFLAIYSFLSPKIIHGEKSLEYFNDLINNEIKKITLDNDEFIYELFFKNDKLLSSMNFSELRYNKVLKKAELLEQNNYNHIRTKLNVFYAPNLYKKEMDKISLCNKEWPYCLNDAFFQNYTQIVFYNIFQETDKKYIENYFFSGEKNQKKVIDEEDDKKYYKIRIERRPHYCYKEDIDSQPNNIINENNNDKKMNKEDDK
jgi:hypothetical protein